MSSVAPVYLTNEEAEIIGLEQAKEIKAINRQLKIDEIKSRSSNVYGQVLAYIEWQTFVDHKGKLRICTVSQMTMAKQLGVSRKQVNKQLSRLVQKGTLHLVGHYNHKQRVTVNIYVPSKYLDSYNAQYNIKGKKTYKNKKILACNLKVTQVYEANAKLGTISYNINNAAQCRDSMAYSQGGDNEMQKDPIKHEMGYGNWIKQVYQDYIALFQNYFDNFQMGPKTTAKLKLLFRELNMRLRSDRVRFFEELLKYTRLYLDVCDKQKRDPKFVMSPISIIGDGALADFASIKKQIEKQKAYEQSERGLIAMSYRRDEQRASEKRQERNEAREFWNAPVENKKHKERGLAKIGVQPEPREVKLELVKQEPVKQNHVEEKKIEQKPNINVNQIRLKLKESIEVLDMLKGRENSPAYINIQEEIAILEMKLRVAKEQGLA